MYPVLAAALQLPLVGEAPAACFSEITCMPQSCTQLTPFYSQHQRRFDSDAQVLL